MPRQFPWREEYLARTKLCYVDLGRLLSDGKRDRSARVPGYVQVELGDTVHLLFVQDGDPVNAATYAGASRSISSISGILQFLASEMERGEAGRIGYYGADLAQLRMMFAAVQSPPLPWGDGEDDHRLERILVEARSREADCVVELSDGERVGYLEIGGGRVIRSFFAGIPPEESGPLALRRFRSEVGPSCRADAYTALSHLPEQAAPGLLDLYAAFLGNLADTIAPGLDRGALSDLLARTIPNGDEGAALSGFHWTPGGVQHGDPVVSPETLTRGMARWVTDIAAAVSDAADLDPSDVLAQAGLRHRYALAETGLFDRIPWPVAWPQSEG